MFVEKYRPRKLSEIIGQDSAVRKVIFWFKNWKPGKKALLLHGPTGVGKTVAARALAAEEKYDYIEMNASDYRTAKQIREVLGKSAQQTSLLRRGKIFVIDEVDGLAGMEDRGGVGEMIKIIKSSPHPVVLISNKPYDSKLRSLRIHCTLVEFGKLRTPSIEKRLREICGKEKIRCGSEVLREISKTAEGDMRSAINDLQILGQGRKEITTKDLEELSKREREKTVFDALKTIFKTERALAAKLALDGVDMLPDDAMWWIENNICREYERADEIAAAFDALSKADIFKSRIRRTQNWRFRAYMVDMMTGGVAVAKHRTYNKFTRYQYPDNIIILGRSKMIRGATRELFYNISRQLHCSSSTFRSDYLPFLKIMLRNKRMRTDIRTSFGVDEKNLGLLAGQQG